MTTVGYGDIVVTTTLERCFCVFGMLIGATVFGYIVGNVSVMMESFDLQSALRTQKMDRVKVRGWLAARYRRGYSSPDGPVVVAPNASVVFYPRRSGI